MRVTSLILACALLLALPVASFAQSSELDQARAAGLVGERIDGFVGVVRADAPAATAALVKRVNAERMKVYRDVAARTGQSLDVVARIAGEKQIAKAPPGQWVMGADRTWKRK